MTFQGKRWIRTGLVMAGLLGLSACGGSSDNQDVGTPGLSIFTITPSAGPNGSIGPASEQQLWTAWTINQGSTASFIVTPDPSYHIGSVGGSCGGTLNGSTYTTHAITADCTVVASFTLNNYSVTASAEANGNIAPSGPQSINHGSTTSFTLTPDTGYGIADVTGTCGGTLNGDTYTTDAITTDCTVIASFNLLPPPEPSLSLTPQSIKTFAFSWADVHSETEYRLLENADGSSGYTEVATIAADIIHYDHKVLLPARINASYLLEACNSSGCTESAAVFVSGTLAEAAGYIKAANTEADDSFGYSVALAADGNTLAVGAYLEDSNTTGINGDAANNDALNTGAVYVFSSSAGAWSQQAYIKADNAGGFDQFGYSLALAANGNTLAVGARLEDGSASGINGNGNNNAAINSGAVYVFTRNDTDWGQQAYVKASNTAAGDEFGYSVALTADGNTLAVSAVNENSSANNSGAVYLSSRNEIDWSEEAIVKATDAANGDNFGHSLALAADGTTLAVGALNAGNGGAAYIFSHSHSDNEWSEQAVIQAAETTAGDNFGHSLALSADGNTLAVGAINEDSIASNSGAVYLFSRSETDWSQQATVKASNVGADHHFGHSVTLTNDGNALAVGAINENSNATGINGEEADTSASNSGAVYLFARNGGEWSQQAYIKAANTQANDQFGTSVALAAEGNTLAVGARGDDSNSGAVYLY
ncbi:MAG TPA: histidine kinase [Cellvibrionaceae bacterium]